MRLSTFVIRSQDVERVEDPEDVPPLVAPLCVALLDQDVQHRGLIYPTAQQHSSTAAAAGSSTELFYVAKL